MVSEKESKKGDLYKRLFAVYQGWKTRQVLHKPEIADIINELKNLRGKIDKIRTSKQPGISILVSAYKFKKQQFKILFDSKLKLSLPICEKKTEPANLTSNKSKSKIKDILGFASE